MKRYIFYILAICIANNAFTQTNKGSLEVRGSIKIDREALSGVKVDVFENGNKQNTHTCDETGKFDCELKLNQEYELVVRKQGYFSKILYINTTIPKEDVGMWAYRFSMELLPFIEGFDASLLKEPIGKIMFVDDFGDFDYDEAYTRIQQKKLAAMMREYERLKKEQWRKVVAQADEAFNNKDYDIAKELYDRAIDLDSYDPYPDDQIFVIGKLISKDKKNQENYNKAIAEADLLLQQQEYEGAKKTYTKALTYLDKQYPKDKIIYIDDLLGNKDALLADQAAKDKAYADAIAAGDRLFTSKQYEMSLEKFNVATGINSVEQYPKDKITEIKGLLAQLANDAKNKDEIEKAYQAAITAADASFAQKTYDQARIDYVKASQLKPVETYPKTKISEIDNLLAANKSKDEQYNGFITSADQSFGLKEYESAKSNYQQALTIKPNEAYPKQKITEIDALLLALQQKNASDKEAVYNQAIVQGDANFNGIKYPEAKTFYIQASTLKPNEAYPKQKIIEIDALLAELANKKYLYDQTIAQADNQFNAESWDEAKVNYQKALTILPKESYPQSRLNEIENKLLALKGAKEQKAAREKAYNDAIVQADAFFAEKKYQESKNAYSQASSVKPNEQYPKGKIAEIEQLLLAQKGLQDRYNAIIVTADSHFTNLKYADAKATYNNALQLKPTEQYPKDKIAEIDVLLAQLAAGKAKSAEIQKQYDAFILQADGAFNQKTWENAKQFYTQASAVKPNEVYPKQRITEIDNMLSGIASQNQKYNNAIASGDNLFNQKSYGESMAFYNQAVGIKSNETYPKGRIAEINKILEDLSKNEAAYDEYITLADQAFSENKLEGAKGQYQAAAAVKPAEDYPKKRITEIDALLEEQRLLLSQQDKLNKQYNTLIATADQYFNQKQYAQAKLDYQKATQLKTSEAYPKEKLFEIDDILGTLAAQKASYDAAMTKGAQLFNAKNLNGALASYQQAAQIKTNEQLPKQKIVEIQGLISSQANSQKQYDGLISLADASFGSKDYAGAKAQYQSASAILLAESYPKSQITKIDQLLAEQQRLASKQKALLDDYNQKIAEADKLYNSKDYNNAMSSYMDAKGIKADEVYPDQQITKINQIMQANQAKLEADYKKAIQQGDQFKTSNKFDDAKGQYQLALSLKPNDQVASSKLIELENLAAQKQADQARLAEVNAKYNNFIKLADNAFKAQDYSSALAMYKSATGVKPTESYPNNQVDECEKKMREQKAFAEAEAEKKRQAELAAAAKTFDGKDFDYAGEQRDRDFLNDLSRKYPEGVTIENYDKPNKKIKRVIVNHGGIAKEYIEVKYSYGTFYFRNGQNISRGIFYSETK